MELTDYKSINGFPDVSENNKLETSVEFLTEEIKRTPEQTVNTVSLSADNKGEVLSNRLETQQKQVGLDL